MSDFVVTNFKEVCKKETIGRPMTPSHWDAKGVTYKKVTQIEMTAGGGMGGSYWSEFIERISLEELSCGNRIVVKKWDGEKILLNLNYMVKAKQMTIASAVLHSKNSNFPIGPYTYNWLIEDGHKIKLVE